MNVPFLPFKNLNFINFTSLNKIFVGILVSSVGLGILAGWLLVGSGKKTAAGLPVIKNPPTASQDTRTFRDFAEGTIQKRPAPKNPDEYVEGTHFLIREGAVPVALTSSVVDLSQYEGKKVEVFGETQKAIKEGWLMDVGKVEIK
jgi:hypothetical protein